MTVLLVFTMAGCQGNSSTEGQTNTGDNTTVTDEITQDGPIQLTVSAEEDNFPMLEGMIESFKKQYPEQEFEISLTVQSDATLRDAALGDVHATADVFHFPDDQLNSLVAGGILEAIPNANEVKKANTEGSVEAASINGTIYAYPMTADNGYFLYYNKDYFTENDLKTLDGILDAAAKAGKKLTMELNSGWYLYSFFGNVGLDFGINDDGVTNHCNWNTTEGKFAGVDVAKSIMDVISHPGFLAASDGTFIENAKAGTVVAAISGVWNAVAVKETWGADYGAVKLPTFTCNGQQVQMSSFTGFKMVGVNSYSKYVDWAHKLANWITNEQNQTVRFVERNQGPSNINAAASDEVMKVPAILAVIDQSQYGVLQRVGNNYWGACTKFVDTLIAGNPDNKPLQKLLDALVAEITASTVK